MKPFLQGKKSLNGSALRTPLKSNGAIVRPAAGGDANGLSAHSTSNATVEVVKQGDKVARLIVTCTCGEKIEIDCIYPVGA